MFTVPIKYLPLIRHVLYPHGAISLYFFMAILSLLLGCGIFIYVMGGTQYAYVHVLYLPIFLAGFIYGIRGGVLTALIATLILGPQMPMNVANQEFQPLTSWLIRGISFLMIGGLSGFFSAIFRLYLENLEQKYLTNPLTELPNFFGLERHFLNLTKSNSSVAIIVVEVGNLRDIEQGIGLLGAQKLLQEVARNIQALADSNEGYTGHTDTADFVVILSDITRVDAFYKECQQHLRTTYTIDGAPLFTELFYGVAVSPHDDATFAGLQRKAKIAIQSLAYRLKPFARYQAVSDGTFLHNLEIIHDLQKAIENKSLTLVYQPIIDLTHNRLSGAEALVRWQMRDKTWLLPCAFLPLAEQTLLINPLTTWVMERAIQDTKDFLDAGLQTTVSVNVSMKNFHNESVLNELFHNLKAYNLDPKFIKLEVTESSVTPNIKEVASVLHKVREQGICISIDDFGTGNASQQYLFELPIDEIKIDQIFVRSLCSNAAAQAIIKSAIILAHDLGFKAVAEGIEGEAEYNILKDMGCDMGQGYLFSPPLSKEEFLKWSKSYASS